MQQTTLHEYALRELGSRLAWKESTQLEYLLAPGHDNDFAGRVEGIRYKSSPEFLEVLHNYVRFLEDGEDTGFWDVEHEGQLIMSKEEMRRLFHGELRRFGLCQTLGEDPAAGFFFCCSLLRRIAAGFGGRCCPLGLIACSNGSWTKRVDGGPKKSSRG